MNELEISIMDSNSGSDPKNELRDVLGNFEEQNRAKVAITLYDWGIAWAEIMKIVLYKYGPGISQVGTTWLGSLEATQAIRPFTPGEIDRLGGADAYHPDAWKSGISNETGHMMALPWFMDTYVLYYRKDLLRKAGVDEASAFESLDALSETIQKLAHANITIPFAMPTGLVSRANLHNVASWVWNNGGDFISSDGKHLLLSEEKTRKGLSAYFSLFRYTPKVARELSDAECYTVFLDGHAAITLRNTSLLYTARHNPAFAGSLKHLGVAAMPGVNFVGGSSIVLWHHIHPTEERLAIELLQQMSLPETQFAYFKKNGFLPTRIEALKRVEAEPFYGPVVQTLLNGRSFHKIKLWGLIEERLSSALAEIWQLLYANENADVEKEIAKVIYPLERRLQLTLSDD